MQVPLLDLKPQYASLRDKIDARLREVIESQQFILGPAVERFEEAVRSYTGAGFAVGMSSGTDAQLALLMALGIGPGDAVITTPYTFFSTAGCIARVGARPVFVDIDRVTLNLSPAALAHYLEHVARDGRIPTGERLRAIIPVHLFGLCAEMEKIASLAAAHGLLVLEDAAQALGAEYAFPNGAVGNAGVMGDAAWFSFFPSKNLGAFGDAGMTVCRDAALAAKLRALRMHGTTGQYIHELIGGNFRLDALQAAVLETKLPYLDAWSVARRENAAFYRSEFTRAGLLGKVILPAEPFAPSGVLNHHIYHQYVIRVPAGGRDSLRAHLSARGIGSAIYYPLPLHLQTCFAYLGYRPGDFPNAEAASRESIALPIYPELTLEQLTHVVRAMEEFHESAA